MKCKFGAIVVDGRGKVGGHVASKNRSGSYFRTKVTPSNPQTQYQQQTRSVLTSLSKSWADLTGDQRQGWNLAVELFKKTNIFGDTYAPTGKNLFVSLNFPRIVAGESLLTNAPAPAGVDFVSIVSVKVATGNITVTFSSAISHDYIFKLEMTPPLTAGNTFFKNKFKALITDVGDDSTTIVFSNTTVYQARFGVALSVGDNVACKITLYDKASGTPGIPYVFRGNVIS